MTMETKKNCSFNDYTVAAILFDKDKTNIRITCTEEVRADGSAWYALKLHRTNGKPPISIYLTKEEMRAVGVAVLNRLDYDVVPTKSGLSKAASGPSTGAGASLAAAHAAKTVPSAENAPSEGRE